MFRPKDINNEIQGYLTALNQLGIVVHKAILFGSMAKGTPTQYSDIDLAVWSSNTEMINNIVQFRLRLIVLPACR